MKLLQDREGTINARSIFSESWEKIPSRKQMRPKPAVSSAGTRPEGHLSLHRERRSPYFKHWHAAALTATPEAEQSLPGAPDACSHVHRQQGDPAGASKGTAGLETSYKEETIRPRTNLICYKPGLKGDPGELSFSREGSPGSLSMEPKPSPSRFMAPTGDCKTAGL